MQQIYALSGKGRGGLKGGFIANCDQKIDFAMWVSNCRRKFANSLFSELTERLSNRFYGKARKSDHEDVPLVIFSFSINNQSRLLSSPIVSELWTLNQFQTVMVDRRNSRFQHTIVFLSPLVWPVVMIRLSPVSAWVRFLSTTEASLYLL